MFSLSVTAGELRGTLRDQLSKDVEDLPLRADECSAYLGDWAANGAGCSMTSSLSLYMKVGIRLIIQFVSKLTGFFRLVDCHDIPRSIMVDNICG